MPSVSVPFQRQAAPSPRKNSARKLYTLHRHGQAALDFLEDQVNGAFGPDSLYFTPAHLRRLALNLPWDEGLDVIMAARINMFQESVEHVPQDDLQERCRHLTFLFANAQKSLHAQALQLASPAAALNYLEMVRNPEYCLMPFLNRRLDDPQPACDLKPAWEEITQEITERITVLQPSRKKPVRQNRRNNPKPSATSSLIIQL